MKSVKMLLTVLILTLIVAVPAMSAAEKEKDFAVTAFADLPLLGTQNTAAQMLAQKQLNALPYRESMQWLDINRDFQLNDFDSKQFHFLDLLGNRNHHFRINTVISCSLKSLSAQFKNYSFVIGFAGSAWLFSHAWHCFFNGRHDSRLSP